MKDQVSYVISRILGIPEEQVGPDSSPATTPNWDSIKHIEIILALEQEFGVRLNALHFAEHTTVSHLAQSLEEKASRQ